MLVAAGALALVVPAGASAATFCVNDPSCPGTNFTTIQAAIDAAHANGDTVRDQIRVAAGQYSEVGIHDDAGNALDLTGAGRGATLLAPAAANNATTLTISEPTSTVSDLAIRTPQGSGNAALSLAGTAQRVAISGANDADYGVTGTAGTFRDGDEIVVPAATWGVSVAG